MGGLRVHKSRKLSTEGPAGEEAFDEEEEEDDDDIASPENDFIPTHTVSECAEKK